MTLRIGLIRRCWLLGGRCFRCGGCWRRSVVGVRVGLPAGGCAGGRVRVVVRVGGGGCSWGCAPGPPSALRGPRPQTPDGLSCAGLRGRGAGLRLRGAGGAGFCRPELRSRRPTPTAGSSPLKPPPASIPTSAAVARVSARGGGRGATGQLHHGVPQLMVVPWWGGQLAWDGWSFRPRKVGAGKPYGSCGRPCHRPVTAITPTARCFGVFAAGGSRVRHHRPRVEHRRPPRPSAGRPAGRTRGHLAGGEPAELSRLRRPRPRVLIGLDPEWTWGQRDLIGLMADKCGVSADPTHISGHDVIDPERTLAALDAFADRIGAVAQRSGRCFSAPGIRIDCLSSTPPWRTPCRRRDVLFSPLRRVTVST